MGPGAGETLSSILESEEPPEGEEVVKFKKQKARHYRPKEP